MRKLVVLLLALMLVGTVGCGTNKKTKDKEPTKKEVVEKESVEDTVDEEAEEETVEEDKATDETSSEETADTQVSNSTAKNETNNNKNNTTNNTSNKTSTTKPSQTVTQPSGGHVHNWTEVKTQVAVPETGHYEPTYAWIYYCDYCKADLTAVDEAEHRRHEKEVCPEGVIMKSYREVGQHWVVDTPSTTEARVTGYKCSCGATREKTQYSGMYTLHDQASWDRINACYQFFKQGLAGADTWISGAGTFLPYGNWESVIVSSGSTDGAWMWIFIRDWKLDNYDYLKDSVADGTNTQEEADMVKALYEEIPRIFKGAIERVAPQGGTELYNYTVNLINQAGGNPDKVPSLAGAQGLIPENIPGLYVTIDELRGGFALTFWAE